MGEDEESDWIIKGDQILKMGVSGEIDLAVFLVKQIYQGSAQIGLEKSSGA